jgi:hypothetical protein
MATILEGHKLGSSAGLLEELFSFLVIADKVMIWPDQETSTVGIDIADSTLDIVHTTLLEHDVHHFIKMRGRDIPLPFPNNGLEEKLWDRILLGSYAKAA